MCPLSTPSLSPRRRRLRWTAAVLSLFVLIGLAVGLITFRKTQPKRYSPGETNPEITSSLTRDLPSDAPKPVFTDVTREAGLAAFRTFTGDRTSQLPEDMGPGAAWGDFDNDGDDDLFLVSAGGSLNVPSEQLLPCELYENDGQGRFRKVANFPELRIHGMAAAWGDYDADGLLDLVVSGFNALILFHNERGTGRFIRDGRFPDLKGFWSGVTWGDYDNDRRLDLYVCGYVQYVQNEADRERGSEQLGTAVPYTLNPASYQPALNLLFHNNGDGTFTDVAPELGVTNPTGRSLAALWHDFDDDGWLDLYVANDVSDNVFYHNVGGKFKDISHAAWVADYRSAMGLAAGDYNRDGDDDLFITHWVAQENALYDNVWADFNAPREVTGKWSNGVSQAASPFNTPALQHSNIAPRYALRFMDVADRKGLGQIALPYVGWGTEFVDFDGDGWLDLIVANGNTLEYDGPAPKRVFENVGQASSLPVHGASSPREPGGRMPPELADKMSAPHFQKGPKRLKPQEPFLFWNRGGEHFFDLAPLQKTLAETHVSRGLAVSDYDNDGDMDILFVHLGEGVQLLRNDMQTGHWLRVRLRSRVNGGDLLGFGDGAKVIAHVRGAQLRRTVSSVSYLSQSSRTLHFGLGEAEGADRLEVRWLGGQTNFFTDLAANATWEIGEGQATARRIEPRAAEIKAANGKGPNLMTETPSTAAPDAASSQAEKTRVLEFWHKQRAAMNALKIEKDVTKAIQLFRQALALNPRHEDSRYYLGQCLAAQGDVPGALAQWEELIRINPASHRAYQQWGNLRALSASSDTELKTAEEHLKKAQAINPEETGALLVLGEIALLRGDLEQAEQRLAAVCRMNPRAVGGLFLRGFLAWKRQDQAAAIQLLTEARQALGKDWQPKGSTAEGDVKTKQHTEGTPLSRYWQRWDGAANSATAFKELNSFLGRAR